VGPQSKIIQIGPYQIIEELGRGAMGVVFRAFDPSIARPVAIKVIRPQQLESEDQNNEARLRFSREANAAGRLSHPNIVTIYQLGQDRGYQYMAMEFVEGAGLEKTMVPGTPMDVHTVLDIVRQVADALDHAHHEGVVHRDIKPSNVLVRPDGRVKIADFGIAHVNSQTLTRQGTTLGTPAYMAPEQIQGAKVDGRSDEFALAVLTYQMLSGYRPFEAATEQGLIFEIVSSEPKPIDQVNPALPATCSEVLQRALAKDPASRYATCSEFSLALTAGFITVAQQTPPAVVDDAAPPPSKAPSKNAAAKWVAAGLGLAAVLGVVSFFMMRPQQTPAPKASQPQAITPAAAPATPPPAAVERPAPAATVSTPVPAKPKKTAPPAMSPADLQAKQDRDRKIGELESKRKQLQGELDQAQRDLDALRVRYKDSFPDVQTAIKKVDALRASIDDVSQELSNLSAPPPGPR